MTAFATLTLNDGSADRAFLAKTLVGNLATWRYGAGTYFNADHQVTMSFSLPKVGGSVVRMKQKIVVPVMDPVDASLKVADIVCNIDVLMPVKATSAQRTVAYNYIKNLLANAVSSDGVVNQQGIF